ncbi:MAG TPA: four helix bundle protein [Thermoanaerobaculia bacterium]|jgi:four helix bundle protein|nr:four helix bundle protein [Thermoanaerobaculia bacterium]
MATFEDLDVFKRALDLMVRVYRVTKAFPSDERFGLTQQLRRAAVSVVSNLAEGQGRLTSGEWRQFLSQSRGSLFEMQAQVIAAHRLEYLDNVQYKQLRSGIQGVAAPLKGLINYVTTRPKAAFNRETTTPRSG